MLNKGTLIMKWSYLIGCIGMVSLQFVLGWLIIGGGGALIGQMRDMSRVPISIYGHTIQKMDTIVYFQKNYQ